MSKKIRLKFTRTLVIEYDVPVIIDTPENYNASGLQFLEDALNCDAADFNELSADDNKEGAGLPDVLEWVKMDYGLKAVVNGTDISCVY